MATTLTPPEPSPTDPKARPMGLALAVLFAVVFLNLVGFGIVVPLLPFFAKSLHAEAWQVTLMFTAYSLGQFFAEPFWGRLSDRIGRKPVLIATTFCNCLGYLALAYAPDIWWAIGIRLFTGLGAGNISTIQGYVADVSPPEKRAGRMGMIGAAFGLGFVVGPSLSSLTVRPDLGHLGYQIPIFVASALTLAASLGVMAFLRESRAKADPAGPRPAFLAGITDAVSNPVVSRVLVVTMIYMAGFAGMESTFGLWADRRYHWTATQLGWCFAVIGVVSAITQGLITGRLARRFGEARVLACGMVLFGASLLAQTLNQIPLLTPVIMGFGALGMSSSMPNITALISRSVSPDRQGAMLGLNMASSSLSRIFAPAIAGALFSSLGPDVPLFVGGLLTLPAAVMAINAGRAFRKRQAALTAQ
jgi:DHA1 family tetracycline resistance protein-like MFS transporter